MGSVTPIRSPLSGSHGRSTVRRVPSASPSASPYGQGNPATSDASGGHDDPIGTEAALIFGYRHTPFVALVSPCECGGHIRSRSDEKAIRRAVSLHNESPVHVAWRTWREDL